MATTGTSIDPSYKFVTVTPSDTELLEYYGAPSKTKGIYIGGSGDLVVTDDLGNDVTFVGVQVGAVYPISTDMIKATGTTATDIVVFF